VLHVLAGSDGGGPDPRTAEASNRGRGVTISADGPRLTEADLFAAYSIGVRRRG
jgi:hypothetical protein